MSLLFYTAANKEYEVFSPVYIYFALKNNPNSYVEIGLEDANKYRKNNREKIKILRVLFGDRFKFTTVNFEGVLPGAVRFITEPTLVDQCDHVYIGDIDILLFDDDIESQHLENMRRYNAPFSNIIRPPSQTEGLNYRLSGLHFAPVDVQYPLPELDDIDYSDSNDIRGADENILYKIMEKKGELIPTKMDFRPEHGIHMRTHSHPFGNRGRSRPKFSFEEISNGNQDTPWSGIEVQRYREQFINELSTGEFQKLYFNLDPKVKNMMVVLENACRDRFSQFEKEAFTYIISESRYEALVRKGSRLVHDEGIKCTIKRVINNIYK
jgi:hypothetical protein